MVLSTFQGREFDPLRVHQIIKKANLIQAGEVRFLNDLLFHEKERPYKGRSFSMQFVRKELGPEKKIA